VFLFKSLNLLGDYKEIKERTITMIRFIGVKISLIIPLFILLITGVKITNKMDKIAPFQK
jgi:hypothetical protein